MQAWFVSCKNLQKSLFGPPDFFGLRSHLGMDTLARPFTYRNWDQSLKTGVVCNSNVLQNLARPKVIVNDWLTVTNWVPRVNDAQGQPRLPKDRNSGGPGTDYLWVYGQPGCNKSRVPPIPFASNKRQSAVEPGAFAPQFCGEREGGIVVAPCPFQKKRSLP